MTDPLVVGLADAAELGATEVGSKAANLAALTAAGFDVPAGFVVTASAFDHPDRLAPAIAAAVPRLGEGLFAVRSSAVAEDLAEASYAGLYETFLDVPGGEVVDAVFRCRAAATAPRVAAYQSAHETAPVSPAVAVLVQRMVPADSAGVVFTANPVTGDRSQTVITAVRGLGERLVSGQADGDEWIVERDRAWRTRRTEDALDDRQAKAVAQLARRVQSDRGTQQDIEWAFAGGRLFLLQSRPMTALPEPVTWTPPGPGLWLRNFRIGEWLPEPMTPLFAGWLLERIAAGLADGVRAISGATLDFPHAAVNGWYYATPQPAVSPRRLLGAFLSGRRRLLRFVYRALVQVNRRPDVADQALLNGLYLRWRDELLPEYRRLVAAGEAEADRAPPERLIALVDELGRIAGVHLWSLAVVGGSAWKMEAGLRRFLGRHLPAEQAVDVAVLLRGLADDGTEPIPYAVSSLDWYFPTFGEQNLPMTGDPEERRARHARLVAQRLDAESSCRAALADRPQLAGRFAALLDVAQRYAVIREEQAQQLTLAWPLLRRCARLLGQRMTAVGIIEDRDDVFFLTRQELTIDPGHPLHDQVRVRRTEWRRQRRLSAPLSLGQPPRLVAKIMTRAGVTSDVPVDAPPDAVNGQPASPGKATGTVRVLRGPDDFARLQPGDILVAPATTPAWTPLFDRAAAVVTDIGTLAAHASLVAREFGIPAVVGTGIATSRLVDGDVVTVDGTAGTVTIERTDRDVPVQYR